MAERDKLKTDNAEGKKTEENAREDARQKLNAGDHIILRELEGDREYDFTVTEFLGMGSSVLCYRATSNRGDLVVSGTLKEIYPYDDENNNSIGFNITRNDDADLRKDNQLIIGEHLTKDFFLAARNRYLNAVKTVSKIRSPISDIYEKIPEPEIYCGITDGECSYYFWYPYEVEALAFNKVLEDIVAQTADNKNKLPNLIFILNVIKNLATAVNILHSIEGVGVCHLDITPGNFGLKTEQKKPTEQISLFDINTLSLADMSSVSFAGTPGFRDPEFPVKPVSKLSYDIFSIGACLFYSIVINKNSEGKLSNICFLEPGKELTERFMTIRDSVNGSLLLNGCEETENRNIRKDLCSILEKFFTPDYDSRYSSLERFLEDINAVIATLNTWQSAKIANANSGTSMRIVSDEKEALSGIGDAVRNLLCEYPLYDYASDSEASVSENGAVGEPDAMQEKKNAEAVSDALTDCDEEKNVGGLTESAGEKRVNILLLGGGLYAGSFIDTASQLMQMKGYKAHFSVLSDEPTEDKEAYLKKRQGLKDYFQIDGVKAALVPDDPYAYIDFHYVKFDTTPSESVDNQRSVFESFLKSHPADYRFVFCALHRDELNYNVARAAKEILSDDFSVAGNTDKPDRVFAYVVFGDRDKDGNHVIDLNGPRADRYASDGLFPVELYGEYEKTSRHRLLEQMAFNIHLLWEGTLANVKDVRKLYDEDGYSKASSLASALTIQYRLKSIDVSLDYENPYDAAQKAKMCLDESTIAELAMYEHRRWNIEKMVAGWTVLPEKEYKVLKTDTKDKSTNRHTCIVPSKAQRGLQSDYWTADGKKNWNEPDDKRRPIDENELARLDPLDKMSVVLHRHFLGQKNEVRSDKINIEIEKLRRIAAGNTALEDVFEIFRASAITFIANGCAASSGDEKSDVSFFKYYKNRFLKLVSEYKTHKEYKDVKETVDAISAELLAVIEAYSYTDYKKKDEDIIKNIPFILTYSDKLIIAAPLEIEKKDPTTLFNNAAALLCLNPEKVYYVMSYNEELREKTQNVKQALNFVTALCRNHGIGTRLHLILLASGKELRDSEAVAKELSAFLGAAGCAEALGYTSDNEYDALEVYLSSHCQGADAINAVEKRGNLFYAVLRNTDKIPWFTFDSKKQEFSFNSAASFVSYLPFMPSLYVDDLFIAKGINSRYKEPQIKNSCKYIWENIYKAPDCEVTESIKKKEEWDFFCAFVKELSQTKLFEIDLESDDTYLRFSYSFPREYKETFEKLMTIFKEKEIVEDFSINYENSYTVSLDINALSAVDEKIHLLLAGGSTFLTDAQKLIIEKDVQKLSVIYDNLLVYDSGEYSSSFSDFSDIAKGLYKEKIICGKTDRSFVCTSSVIKKLLSDNEFIFRLYVYYKLIETGYFDEVRTDVSFDIGSSAEDEIDILAVKGFRTFIISCKATADTDLLKEANAKTFAKARSSGINSQGILIADTMKNNEKFFNRIAPVIEANDIIGIFRNEELFNTSAPDSRDVGTSIIQKLYDR